MNPSPKEAPTTPLAKSSWRIVVLVVCVGAAFAAALVWKDSPMPNAAVAVGSPAQPTPLTQDQILAAIPLSAGSTETDKALGVTLGKVRKTPQDGTGWVNLGDTLAQVLRDTANEKYYDHAEAAYQYALRVNPRSVDAMIGMAWASGGRHLFDKSRDWANQALAVDPNNAAACGILGDADVEAGDYDAAFEHYQRMMDLKPDLSSWSRGAHLLWLTGDSKKAMWLMEKALKAGAPFAENTAWCRAKFAIMLFHEGAFIPAAQMLEPALQAAPKNTHVLLAAGRIAAARQDFPAAEKYFQRVLEGAPNHDALVGLGDLHAAKGEKAEAEGYYAQVEALDALQTARAGHAHLALAKFYADHDRKLIEALRMAEERKLTRNVNEADTLAWVYFKNGDQSRAMDAMKRALSLKTPDAEMHFHAGMIAAAAGDPAAARQHLQQALTFNPQFSVLQAPIAVKALAQLSSAPSTVTAGPESPEVTP